MVIVEVMTPQGNGLVGTRRWSMHMASRGTFMSSIRQGIRRGNSTDGTHGSSSSVDTEVMDSAHEGNTIIHSSTRELCSVFGLLGR